MLAAIEEDRGATEAAIEAFQERGGLEPTGKLGDGLREKLASSYYGSDQESRRHETENSEQGEE